MKIVKTRDEMLLRLPKRLVVAELGVFVGDFSRRIYELMQPRKLYLVDKFTGRVMCGDKDGRNCRRIKLDGMDKKLAEVFSDLPSIEIVKSLTTAFLSSLPDNSLDAVYLDANHDYENVREELALSFRKVKSTGYIMGHDYAKMFKGVIQAVNEFCHNHKLGIQYLTQDGLPSYCIKVEE